jgi:amino acid adenylation domain-containing protein
VIVDVTEAFARQVVATPTRAALAIGDAVVGYAELAARVEAIRRVLPAAPVIAGYFDHRIDAVAAFLAVMSQGSCYVPLAPVQGASRVVAALAASGATVLLSDGDLLPDLGGAVPATVIVAADARDRDGPAARVIPGSLAYVIYTSGSTGQPKGVAISPRALVASTAARLALYGPGGTLFLAAPLCFDSALALFAPLVSGGTVRLSSPAAERDAVRIAGECRDCTHALLLPSVYREVLEVWGERQPHGLAVAIVAGEAAPPALVRRHFALAPGRRLVNEYGPTEATVFCTAHECADVDAAAATVPIGRAVDGYRVVVAGDDGRPLSDGEVGELRVAGPGLAEGYLGDAALTAQRFVAGDHRWYRTGDRARRRPDGALELLGRIDDQVKVRGVRVELGEVERLLADLPGVREAAAVVVDGVLIGFVRGACELGDVRVQLPRDAPAYLVPQTVHQVDELPRTATGKLDRPALIARVRRHGDDVRIPDSSLDPDVGIPDSSRDRDPEGRLRTLELAVHAATGRLAASALSFTTIGDSLAAMRVCSRLYAHGWLLDPTALLHGRCLADAAGQMEPRAERPACAVTPGPLSPNQAGIWFADRLAPDGALFLVPLRVRLDGVPDLDRLRAALRRVVRRHPVLDCRIEHRAGRPVLVRVDDEPWLDHVVVGHEHELDVLAAVEASDPIDLRCEPALRATLVELPDRRAELLLTVHHIAFDGWSRDLLLRDLCEAYRGVPERPRPGDFLGYAARQAAIAAAGGFATEASQVAERLRSLPTRLSLRERDDARPTHRAEGRVLDLDAALHRDLSALAHAHHTTLFVALLGGFAEGLAQVTGQRQFLLGTVAANRADFELEEAIGLFANIVPIALDLDGDAARADRIGHVRDRVLAAMRHAHIPFPAVIAATAPERTPDHAPLVQILFEYFADPRTRYDLDGIELTVRGDGLQQGAVADLSLRVFPHDAGLRCVAVRDASVVLEPAATAVLQATIDAWRRMVAR